MALRRLSLASLIAALSIGAGACSSSGPGGPKIIGDAGENGSIDAGTTDAGETNPPAPGTCTTAADCDDHLSCTTDTCESGACKYAAVPSCGVTVMATPGTPSTIESQQSGLKIEIPAGAVSSPVEVTAQVAADLPAATLVAGLPTDSTDPSAALDIPAPVLGATRFGPSGTVFAHPITITLPLAPGGTEDNVLPPGSLIEIDVLDEAAGRWNPGALASSGASVTGIVSANGRTVQFLADHFSVYGAGKVLTLPGTPNGDHPFLSKFAATDTANFYPSGLAIDSKGNVWVTDLGSDRLVEFDASGKLLKTIGIRGSGQGQFIIPTSIALDAKDNLYVTDASGPRIEILDPTGAYLRSIGGGGASSADGKFQWPQAVSVSGNGHVFVGDRDTGRIQEFDEKGTFLRGFTPDALGHTRVAGVIAEPTGDVVVLMMGADSSTRNMPPRITGGLIRRYDSNWTLKQDWAPFGYSAGQLYSPAAIWRDVNGDFYVTDSFNGTVNKFSKSGAFLGKWGSAGSGDGAFNRPFGVGVDGNGNVYVADTFNSRVQKFGPVKRALNDCTGLADGEFCVDGDDCTTNDVCTGGKCGGKKLLCCGVAEGGACDDGDSCTSGDSCHAGTCAGSRLETKVVNIGASTLPVSLAFDSKGDMFVSDYTKNQVIHFDATGKSLGTIGAGGGAHGLQYPRGVAFTSKGELWVADLFGSRIQKYDATGKWLQTVGTSSQPTDVAIAADGTIYVGTAGGKNIQKYDATGKYLGLANAAGAVGPVNSVALAADGGFYVTEMYTPGVTRLDKSGKLVTRWGTVGAGDGQFGAVGKAFDVVVDGAGNVWVTDSANFRVQEFDASGKFLAKFGLRGAAAGQFMYPYGLAVSGGSVAIVDATNKNVTWFTPVCQMAGDSCTGKADGTACDDKDKCTGGDFCQKGVCAGAAIACCGSNDGTKCDDGNSCTNDDQCKASVCKGTTPPVPTIGVVSGFSSSPTIVYQKASAPIDVADDFVGTSLDSSRWVDEAGPDSGGELHFVNGHLYLVDTVPNATDMISASLHLSAGQTGIPNGGEATFTGPVDATVSFAFGAPADISNCQLDVQVHSQKSGDGFSAQVYVGGSGNAGGFGLNAYSGGSNPSPGSQTANFGATNSLRLQYDPKTGEVTATLNDADPNPVVLQATLGTPDIGSYVFSVNGNCNSTDATPSATMLSIDRVESNLSFVVPAQWIMSGSALTLNGVPYADDPGAPGHPSFNYVSGSDGVTYGPAGGSVPVAGTEQVINAVFLSTTAPQQAKLVVFTPGTGADLVTLLAGLGMTAVVDASYPAFQKGTDGNYSFTVPGVCAPAPAAPPMCTAPATPKIGACNCYCGTMSEATCNRFGAAPGWNWSATNGLCYSGPQLTTSAECDSVALKEQGAGSGIVCTWGK